MGKRLLDADEYESAAIAPAPVDATRRVTRDIVAQAQNELRRNARTNYGETGQRQAQTSRATVSRLVSGRSPQTASIEHEDKLGTQAPFTTAQIAKAGGILAGSFVVGGGLAIAGVAEVLAVAAQPAFLGAGLIAGGLTYAAGGIIERMRGNVGCALTVQELSVDGPGVISAHINGTNLESLPIVAGQSADWTFLIPELRHFPIRGYLSCVPRDGMFRVMFLADDPQVIQALRMIQPGTRLNVGEVAGVNAEQVSGPSLILAAGDGVIAGRGLLEALPGGPGDVAMLYRIQSQGDAMLVDELREVGGYRGSRVGVIVGPNSRYPENQKPFCPQHLIASTPDIAKRNIFVLGPKPMVSFVAKSLQRLGLHRDQVHFEII